MEKVGERKGYHMVQKLGRTKIVIKVGKISEKMTSLQFNRIEYPLLGIRQKEALK